MRIRCYFDQVKLMESPFLTHKLEGRDCARASDSYKHFQDRALTVDDWKDVLVNGLCVSYDFDVGHVYTSDSFIPREIDKTEPVSVLTTNFEDRHLRNSAKHGFLYSSITHAFAGQQKPALYEMPKPHGSMRPRTEAIVALKRELVDVNIRSANHWFACQLYWFIRIHGHNPSMLADNKDGFFTNLKHKLLDGATY